MADFKKVKAEMLNDIGLEILVEYENKNLRASGRFESIVKIENRGGQPVLILPAYTKYITEGGGSIGGFNPFLIEQWIKDKGIIARDRKTGRFASHKRIAFAIATKIRDQGTDIFQGKREGIYLTTAINRGLKNSVPNLANQIVDQIFAKAGLKSNITISL